MVHLYRAVNGATTMVNRELVDRECATWLDTTIVKLDSPLEHPSNMWSNLGNFQNRNLGPYAWDQISTIYFVPDPETLSLDPSLSPLEHPSNMWSNLGNFQNRNLGPYA